MPGSGARATMKKMASARQAPWLMPSTRTHSQAAPSGAHSSRPGRARGPDHAGHDQRALAGSAVGEHRHEQRGGQVAHAHQGQQVARP